MSEKDGRHIDPSLGALEGEAAQQATIPAENPPAQLEVWHATQQYVDGPTYYDKPVIKSPVWIWSVPAYFYTGGMAGAAMVLGLATQLFGGRRLRGFDERCRWIGAIGGGVGSALLIYDLGRKSRFLNMLRVFRPTSPMSIGSWVLAAATPLSAGSALLTFAEGPLYRLGQSAGVGAGVLGLPLATYTAVLISNTAVPLWQESRRILPLLFGASSMASLGSVFDLMKLDTRERAIADTFGTVGRVCDLAASYALERSQESYRQGLPGALWTTAKVATAAALVLSLTPGKSRAKRIATGVLGTVGALCLRFAVFHAGKQSALDPRATFRQQRARRGGAEVTGRAAVTQSEGMRLRQPDTGPTHQLPAPEYAPGADPFHHYIKA
jgi:formate-dependent nitrite reductase membrane component NrfD